MKPKTMISNCGVKYYHRLTEEGKNLYQCDDKQRNMTVTTLKNTGLFCGLFVCLFVCFFVVFWNCSPETDAYMFVFNFHCI